MSSIVRNARALRATPVLVLAFLLTSGGGAPAAKVERPHPNAEQALAGVTANPTLTPDEGVLALPAFGPSRVSSERRIAEFTADAIAKAAAAERKAELVKARAEARAKARAEARSKAKAESKQPAAPVYRGSNHFWIPSLGMSYNVHAYPCSRSKPPANYIYRWYCAGENNVYILGHAWGVMKPLHDLYVSGGLRKGMIAVYANGAGNVTKYRVVSWRVVDPTESEWAIASQPVPSMTLQTCVGKDGSKRLNVRLVAV